MTSADVVETSVHIKSNNNLQLFSELHSPMDDHIRQTTDTKGLKTLTGLLTIYRY